MLDETDEDIAKKVKTMYTDPLRIKATDPGHPDGCVVFAFHEIFNKDAQTRKQECINGCVGCVKCKKELTEMICEFSRPILKKRQELANDKKYVEDILKEGSLKAEQVASQTMKEIREAVKL